MAKLITAVLLGLFVLFLPSAVFAEEYDINHPLVAEIAGYLSMDGHSEHDLATCEPKYRTYNEITDMLNEGYTKDEILEEYKLMYGEEGFRAPDRRGFSLAAWVLPFVALGAGTWAIVGRIKNSVKLAEKHEADEAHSVNRDTQDETEDEILRSILEEEKKKHF